jgi:hypothetical protein
MTTTELLILGGSLLVAVWIISLIWFFIALAYDMLKEQDKDYEKRNSNY